MQEQTEKVLHLSQNELLEFCGNRDEKIRELQSRLDARLVVRGNQLKIIGPADVVDRTARVVQDILDVVRKGGRMSEAQFRQAVKLAGERVRSGRPPMETTATAEDAVNGEGAEERMSEIMTDFIPIPLKRRSLAPLTSSQRRYIKAIRDNVVTFGIGPAGTGKTYLAMAMAAAALSSGEVNRIILCRPAVEAGERLGFLPGDLAQKFDPYVRPLWDALYEMMDGEKIKTALESGVIEIAPLAYMRGRTLNNSFVILDEGQNTTVEQMKMFLTRLGFDSKAVVTGDVTQIDLPRGQMSGLVHARRVLSEIEGVGMVTFHNRDVVRHPLLTKIIQAYEQEGRRGEPEPAERQDRKAEQTVAAGTD